MKKHTGRRTTETFLGDVYDRLQALERLNKEIPMIPYRFVASGGGDEQLIAAGTFHYRGHYVSNAHGEFVYVHIYDKASSPDSGDTPVFTIGVPFESGANMEYSEGVGNDDNTDDPEVFGLGIGVAVSLDPSDSSAGVPGDLIVVTILYSEA